MLEHQSLRLLAWTGVTALPSGRDQVEADASRRAILDAATGLPLGYASCSDRNSSGWLGWFLAPGIALEVHETDDDSLLFTMQSGRRWRLQPRKSGGSGVRRISSVSRWEVRDAEEHFVGSVERSGLASLPLPALEQTDAHANGASAVARDNDGRAFIVSSLQPGYSMQPLLGTQRTGPSSWAELGALSCSQSNYVLDFSSALKGEPFVKMLLLAAVIVTTSQ